MGSSLDGNNLPSKNDAWLAEAARLLELMKEVHEVH